MSKNLAPKELESQYENSENFFDFWNIQKEDEYTVFYVVGKFVFKIKGDLTPEQIIEQMNNFEFIYSTAFKKGVQSNQTKIKEALGINQ